MKLLKLSWIALLAALLFAAPASADAERPPQLVVETLHAALIDVMRNADALGFDGRAEQLAPVVRESFDFATIARIVTGRAWQDLGADAQAAFIDLFRRLSVATYASNFSGYAGEQFVTGSTEESRGATIVKTDLVKSDGERIPMNYMLRKSDGAWRIINVVAQGVSDLSLKRAEYGAVIKAEGFDSLMNRLRDKVRQLGQKP
ncbi:MAG: ABC transporter substrate-binding protein [Gammaproteobacteria bacterium]